MAPVWLSKAIVRAMHERLLAEHGGSAGLRDPGLLDSELARPRQLHACGAPEISDLATAYAAGIIRNHPVVDGNKRTGFMCAYLFLAENGFRLIANEVEVVQVVTLLAAGEINEAAFAAWLRDNTEAVPPEVI